MITVLAFHLLRWVEQKMAMVGHTVTFRNVRRLLQTHSDSTICLPAKDGKLHTIRRPGVPDQRQTAVYQALGIDLAALSVARMTSLADTEEIKDCSAFLSVATPQNAKVGVAALPVARMTLLADTEEKKGL